MRGRASFAFQNPNCTHGDTGVKLVAGQRQEILSSSQSLMEKGPELPHCSPILQCIDFFTFSDLVPIHPLSLLPLAPFMCTQGPSHWHGLMRVHSRLSFISQGRKELWTKKEHLANRQTRWTEVWYLYIDLVQKVKKSSRISLLPRGHWGEEINKAEIIGHVLSLQPSASKQY